MSCVAGSVVAARRRIGIANPAVISATAADGLAEPITGFFPGIPVFIPSTTACVPELISGLLPSVLQLVARVPNLIPECIAGATRIFTPAVPEGTACVANRVPEITCGTTRRLTTLPLSLTGCPAEIPTSVPLFTVKLSARLSTVPR